MPIPLLTLGLATISQGQDAPRFSDADRQAIIQYWSDPGRYAKSETKSPKGQWVVRLSPEGSQWLYRYNRARGLSKGNPAVDVGALNPDQAVWEKWIDAKVAYDRATASKHASELNGTAAVSDDVDEPGAMPDDLHELVGDAPCFAAVVKQTTYTVTFDDGSTYQYKDAVDVRGRYPYYRSTAGVTTSGKSKLELDESSRLCQMAGLSDTERRVMAAVSPLEGGYDSINTYDSGFVSVGFIQFACLQAGAGSLGAVLRREKSERPDSFLGDFHRFGVDVTDDGKLDVLDPVSGTEFSGPAAAAKIIEDKRLTAVFQRAGQKSDAFRVAQLETAHDMFYPGNDAIQIQTDSGPLTYRIGDIVRSEAGLAVLMDRKVNTGNLNALKDVVTGVIRDTGAQTADELAAHEMEIVQPLIFRHDFLADANLSQPTALRQASLNSRHGDRVQAKAKPKAKPKAPPKPAPEPAPEPDETYDGG